MYITFENEVGEWVVRAKDVKYFVIMKEAVGDGEGHAVVATLFMDDGAEHRLHSMTQARLVAARLDRLTRT